jgi:hypothetical protein
VQRLKPRVWVAFLTLLLQLLGLTHLAVVDHTLGADGALVHAADLALVHDHQGPSLCADELPARTVETDALAQASVTPPLLRSPLVSAVVFSLEHGPQLVEQSQRRPLSWAPKASPPAAS